MTTEQILQARDGIWRLANLYNTSHGREPIVVVSEQDIPDRFTTLIADAYAELPQREPGMQIPDEYNDLKREIVALWTFLAEQGVEIIIPSGAIQPFADVEPMIFTYAGTKRVAVYSGTTRDSVLSEECKETGYTYQAKLRAIEYFFGHMMGNFSFNPEHEKIIQHETLAFLLFSQLLSDRAMKAAIVDLLARKLNSLTNIDMYQSDSRVGLLPDGLTIRVESPVEQINLAL